MPLHSKEKRHHKRYAIKGCWASFKADHFLNLLRKTSKKYIVLDISRNGLQFATPKNFKSHTRLLFNISAPLLEKNIIRARGRISWTRKASGLNIYGVGVEFMVLDPLAQTRLESLLSKATRDKVEISRHVHLKQIKEL